MNNDHTYIGFIYLNKDNQPILITKQNGKYFSGGIINSEFNIDSYIIENEVMIVAIKYFDGTESVTFEYAESIEYEDIIYAIETYGIINFDDSIEKELDNYDNLNMFWGIVEEYFETEEGLKKLNNFKEKDCWKDNK